MTRDDDDRLDAMKYGVPEHHRPDILAMIDRGDFDEK